MPNSNSTQNILEIIAQVLTLSSTYLEIYNQNSEFTPEQEALFKEKIRSAADKAHWKVEPDPAAPDATL